MPETIKLEDGSEREVLTAEEQEQAVKAQEELKTAKEQLAEKDKTLEENVKNLETTKTELGKLQNKDFNFKKLRDMTDEEREKLTGREKELIERQEKLEEKQKSFEKEQTDFTSRLVNSHKDDAIAVLVGDDKELREKVLKNYDRILGDALTKEEINNKMREAFNMTGVKNKEVDPLTAGYNSEGNSAVAPKGKLTDEQKALGRMLGLTDEELKKAK